MIPKSIAWTVFMYSVSHNTYFGAQGNNFPLLKKENLIWSKWSHLFCKKKDACLSRTLPVFYYFMYDAYTYWFSLVHFRLLNNSLSLCLHNLSLFGGKIKSLLAHTFWLWLFFITKCQVSYCLPWGKCDLFFPWTTLK